MLLASVTSEASVGGSMRTSLCAVETGVGVDSFALTKHASTVSYGAYSGGLLVTARAHPDARDTDQVLVVVPTAQCVIEQRCAINTMGMRGTASESFVLRATGSREQIMPIVFSEIAAQTMTPVSHLLWAALWCGIAADAVTRARAFLKGLMRSNGGAVPDRAARLVQAVALLQAAEARVRDALISHERSGSMASFAETASINTVKTGTSEACLAVAEEAMLVCGFAGYSNEGRFSISRHLRDLHSARLMVHNDRIRDNTARLLLMQTPRFGVD
jgi:acyl-CoA dehydrogenase